ncbi:hypothetical protein CLV63_13558 [Murinocardiopsis flavida]|uniref:DUF3558 domain-containing protein n=1 Tax=Murinocardiopsis flavida TaxID=645275 RepID=A0A2P8CMU5_9ACTN|nr:hypothetical protein [Murinocardiopsis flavida]PSK86289.1 hypothetical protein CLV63_13558 [Murinocardiopsis flavida]
MPSTPRARAPWRAAPAAGALLLAVLCAACGGGAPPSSGAPAESGSPSASTSPSPSAPDEAGDGGAADTVPATCTGGAAEKAAAEHTRGMPFTESAKDGLLTCNWGEEGEREHLFVQFQAGETFADPDGADPDAEQGMGVRTTPQSSELGGKLQYTDLGSVGRSAVLYLPGVSVTANAVGSDLGQSELEAIVLAAAGDLP